MRPNHPAPPIRMAKTFGPQWVGKPQNTLRPFTIQANLARKI